MRIVAIAALLVLFFGFLQVIFLRLFVKEWWKNNKIRNLAWGLPVLGIIGTFFWGIGEYYTNDIILYPAAVFTVMIFILEICLTLSLPFSGFFKFVNFGFDYFKTTNTEDVSSVDKSRRKILQSAAAAVPLLALTSGTVGVLQTLSSVRVYIKPILFANLPDDLNGFRILHLSDLHLRHYTTLPDLEDVLLQAEKFSPDMILFTGDIADNLHLLPDALKMVDQMKTPYGCYACLGNHEHFRGITTVRYLFNKSPVPLLVNSGETIQVGKSSLFIGGIDDPVRMGAKEHQFYVETIDKTLNTEHGVDFKLLMSHRPDALDYASEKGINLTLAGHTHGGQMGFNGRSLLESTFPDRYLWGDYSIGESKLYTSSGMGHWFPFRLGCPTEAPVIELQKS